MASLSRVLGYILNFIYNIVSNYGIAIILFSLLLKVLMLPLTIKQQKTLIKTNKLQGKIKEIQKKYTNKEGKTTPEDQTKMNQELMDLYKKENMSPLSGCLSTIIQLILLFAIFGLVRNPLTYMKKIDSETIEKYKIEMSESTGQEAKSTYPEIGILDYVNKNKGKEDPLYINMDLFGLDLNKIPKDNFGDFSVYIIPVLYVLTSIISMKISTSKPKEDKKEKDIIIEKEEENIKEKALINIEKEEPDMAEQMNKSMSWFMPLMAVSVALMAPLGLALYWLLNNILMIIERIIISKVLETKKKEA